MPGIARPLILKMWHIVAKVVKMDAGAALVFEIRFVALFPFG
jgi:hypothetical protein